MALTSQQVMQVVNRYIGVSGGYLGDFSYRTHQEFYSEYCGIDGIETDTLQGTTRERFISILTSQGRQNQARILRGVIAKFGDNDEVDPKRIVLRKQMEDWALELESGSLVVTKTPDFTREVVRRALGDIDALIKTNGPISAVDRIHTALHGHLLALAEAAAITLPGVDPSLTTAMKALREGHPGLIAAGARADEVTQILYAISNALDKLNIIRNNASVAHPNVMLLGEPEARLALNAGRTIFAYVDEKLGTTT